MAARVVGVDFGRDTIRAVELENADKPRPTVVKYGEIAVAEGALQNGEVRQVDTVAAALKRLWSASGFSSKKVVLGMANQRVVVREITMPRMSIEQIREALPFQVQDLLPVPVNDAVMDFYPAREVDGPQGPVVAGLLVAAIKESVLANVNAVTRAGLQAVGVDLVPFALSRVLVRGPIADATVMIVDIGANSTNVTVTSRGVAQFVRSVPGGGHTVTQALQTRLEVTEQQAAEIKSRLGLGTTVAPASEQDVVAIEVIRASSLELFNSLRNTLSFYSTQHSRDPIQAVLLSGGGGQLLGLSGALAEVLHVDVVAADPFSGIEFAKSAVGADPHRMSVALGLAIGTAA